LFLKRHWQKNDKCWKTIDAVMDYLLTPWSRVLLEKLTSKLVKKFPAFMEPKSPSPYPQVPATCPVYGCMILPLETPPPREPSGGVVYLRIILSLEEASQLMGNS
jgi:hypothetical protein